MRRRRLPWYRRAGRWVFPTGRVPFPYLDPEIYQVRFNERCDRLPVFIKHRIRYLITQNCYMVLEADAGGAYRAILKHFWQVLKHDYEGCKWTWRVRFSYARLRLSGWDKTAIAIKYEHDMEAEFARVEEAEREQ